jgi:hypothetical protein
MVATMIRLRGQDKASLDLAAQHMGMPRAQLMRVLLVKGAERILKELGVEIDYQQNEHVDLTKGETLIEETGD